MWLVVATVVLQLSQVPTSNPNLELPSLRFGTSGDLLAPKRAVSLILCGSNWIMGSELIPVRKVPGLQSPLLSSAFINRMGLDFIENFSAWTTLVALIQQTDGQQSTDILAITIPGPLRDQATSTDGLSGLAKAATMHVLDRRTSNLHTYLSLHGASQLQTECTMDHRSPDTAGR